MSSAALHAAPHQSPTITSLPSASQSTRQYPPSSQQRDAYYTQPTANAPPVTTRRPSRRPSGNGNGASPVTQQQQQQQQQQQYYTATASPPSSSPSLADHTNVRAANMAAAEYQRGMPPLAPPRTSSNQRSSGTALAAAASAAASSSDRARRTAPAADERAINAARVAAAGDGSAPDGYRESRQTNGNRERAYDESNATPTDSRTRRRAQQSPGEATPQGPNSGREGRNTQQPPSQSRSQQVDAHGPVRETSDILSRLVISQPEVDIERERERMAESVPHPYPSAGSTQVPGSNVASSGGADDGGRAGERRRQDHSTTKREKNTRFGEYFLGNTLGEGEFGKVKMGWKQEGGVQVAIKLIRRDSVGTNPTRLAKIYREIAILREISHPNIVRLHEMVETEKHIGIILEYASGGELFDYILNHRYLKDNAARRLFAQLVSGVGYLHKKGIVHRDLKLENLLLDRNRNIIITDFGFANTFNPADELGEDIEHGLSSRDYVKRMELDKILPGGYRRGDLMQTSCGSPCYAAPELVVSDSLYTGRKVDVWSCGVILYAMLAGYLPFDDDPANPEGDNINLLYKYIVSTPLTFPEYVTPHARDLLRRILVPDPRKRADLFEVARHSWLSEYAHVVGFITSNTTTPAEIQNTTVMDERSDGAPLLARSASVREPTKSQKPVPAVGDLARKPGNLDQDADDQPKPTKDAKRRTLQVEYVAPRQQTTRGEDAAVQSGSKPRARSDSQGQIDLDGAIIDRRAVSGEKPLPQAPSSRQATNQQFQDTKKPPSSHRNQASQMPPPSRPGREPPRSVSDNAFMSPLLGPSVARPNTGGSMTSTASGRNRYSQTAAPTLATMNAHGHMSQPTAAGGKRFEVTNANTSEEDMGYGRPSVSQGVPAKFARIAGIDGAPTEQPAKTHKRSSTIGSMSEKIFGRHSSIFGGKADKPKKSYPPVSYAGGPTGVSSSRPSMDSRRSFSLGFGKKRSGSVTGSTGGDSGKEKSTRRFSLIPGGFSLKAIGIGKDYDSATATPPDEERYYDDGIDRSAAYNANPQSRPQSKPIGSHEASRDSPQQETHTNQAFHQPQQHYQSQPRMSYDGGNEYAARQQYRPQTQDTPPPMQSEHGSYPNLSQPKSHQPMTQSQHDKRQQQSYNDYEADRQGGRQGKGVLQKNNRRFMEAYEGEGQDTGYAGPTHTSGSSGAARKVMDFFRRRGRDRGGE